MSLFKNYHQYSEGEFVPFSQGIHFKTGVCNSLSLHYVAWRISILPCLKFRPYFNMASESEWNAKILRQQKSFPNHYAFAGKVDSFNPQSKARNFITPDLQCFFRTYNLFVSTRAKLREDILAETLQTYISEKRVNKFATVIDYIDHKDRNIGHSVAFVHSIYQGMNHFFIYDPNNGEFKTKLSLRVPLNNGTSIFWEAYDYYDLMMESKKLNVLAFIRKMDQFYADKGYRSKEIFYIHPY
jgi:hypothetical protein